MDAMMKIAQCTRMQNTLAAVSARSSSAQGNSCYTTGWAIRTYVTGTAVTLKSLPSVVLVSSAALSLRRLLLFGDKHVPPSTLDGLYSWHTHTY